MLITFDTSFVVELPLWQNPCIPARQMLPSSNQAPMNALAATAATRTELTDAFAAFITAADRLEHSHSQLHEEVARLRAQLEERNRALADSLAENERMHMQLGRILDTMPCGIVVFDQTSRKINLLNPEARRLLGLENKESMDWSRLPAAIRGLVDHNSAQSATYDQEYEVGSDKGGEKRWMTVRSSVMDQATIGSKQIILIIREITMQKQAEQDREASRHMLALAEMASVLAHEIRNPLGSLELLTGLLANDSSLKSDSQEYVQHLRAGVRSLSSTVDNVLRFHNLGEAQLVPTQLASALKSTIEFIGPLAEQKQVTLTLKESLGKTEIAADCNGLQQVILNLTINSLRHTPSGGSITISGSFETGEDRLVAVVEFSDNGCGIPAENLDRIFEPGFSTARQSAGLGLAVCRRIINQHKGTITVDSQPGEGTTFRMEFPVL